MAELSRHHFMKYILFKVKSGEGRKKAEKSQEKKIEET